jgi:phage/plasmid primase-like uncharacterized protein
MISLDGLPASHEPLHVSHAEINKSLKSPSSSLPRLPNMQASKETARAEEQEQQQEEEKSLHFLKRFTS